MKFEKMSSKDLVRAIKIKAILQIIKSLGTLFIASLLMVLILGVTDLYAVALGALSLYLYTLLSNIYSLVRLIRTSKKYEEVMLNVAKIEVKDEEE